MNGSDVTQASRCLIGHTGFVGAALMRQGAFEHRYNSKNIAQVGGRAFDTVVCAAAPGSMLEANKAPERDRTHIHELIDQLSAIKAERFILISSIAVLADFAGGDDEFTSAFQQELAYGRHRRELEAFVEGHFEHSLIVRLPALFGRGLRKNFIFDLLNPVPSMLTREKLADLENALDTSLAAWLNELYSEDAATGMLRLDRSSLNADGRRGALENAVSGLGVSATQFHNPQTTLQYYEIDRLWADIGVALSAGLSRIHLVSEPMKAHRIYRRLMGHDMPETGARLHREDMHTAHAGLWGSNGQYQFDAATTLDRLTEFVANERALA